MYLKNKFNINEKDVFQLDSNIENAHLGKYSSIVFLNGIKITTVEDIRALNDNNCNEKKFLKNLTVERIDSTMVENKKIENIFFRNLINNTIISSQNEKIAVFFFTYKLGNAMLNYYEHKKYVENLGFKCILLTMDDFDIADLKKPNSTKLKIIKK